MVTASLVHHTNRFIYTKYNWRQRDYFQNYNKKIDYRVKLCILLHIFISKIRLKINDIEFNQINFIAKITKNMSLGTITKTSTGKISHGHQFRYNNTIINL